MRRFSSAISFLCLALAAPLALAQTTGDIVGRVTDEQGGALPGVTVEAREPRVPGRRARASRTRPGRTASSCCRPASTR